MDLFVFPLVNVNLFPKTTKPLNIFEPRYLQMIKDAAEQDKPVAIGFIDDPSKITSVPPGEKIEFINEIVGYGNVQIVEERANGFLLIFLHGIGKAKLGPVKNSSTPYFVCDAEPIVENLVPSQEHTDKIHTLNKVLAKWIAEYFSNPMQSDMFLKQLDGPEAIVSAFSAYLVKDFDAQQTVLEMNDINDKIDFLYRVVLSAGTL